MSLPFKPERLCCTEPGCGKALGPPSGIMQADAAPMREYLAKHKAAGEGVAEAELDALVTQLLAAAASMGNDPSKLSTMVRELAEEYDEPPPVAEPILLDESAPAYKIGSAPGKDTMPPFVCAEHWKKRTGGEENVCAGCGEVSPSSAHHDLHNCTRTRFSAL